MSLDGQTRPQAVAYNPARRKASKLMNKLIGAAAILALARGWSPRPAASACRTRVTEPLAIVNANLVNVRNGRVTPNASIVIRNGRIDSIGSGPRRRPGVARAST